ncbi:hypothetical protein [Butyrivibrio sp. FC2001]|uniref:hypothetical protein n=1 Tax=Butyrivibrio sp. FC2001 TaxID=1280671 RepID=UPI00047BADD1|nr:hypothetical protein [Butyrivibrio sp. FC2001]
MKEGQKFLVLKYGTHIIDNCISKHIEVVNKYGYCWFGKVGTIPSDSFMNEILDTDEPTMILCGKDGTYQCVIDCFVKDKPKSGCPPYYKEYLFDKGVYPSEYYRIISIKEIDKAELGKYVCENSRNNLLNSVNRSMSPFFRAIVPINK